MIYDKGTTYSRDGYMRILIIPTADLSYNSGSVIYAKKLMKYLLGKGHDVYMISKSMADDLSEDEKKRIILRETLLFHPIIDDRIISDHMYYKMCIDILDAVNHVINTIGPIDIIHAHYASINSYAASLINDLLAIPFVVSTFGRDISRGYKCDNRIKRFIEKSYRQASHIIVPDNNIKQLVCEVADSINGKVKIIPMPVDKDIFKNGNLDNLRADNTIIISTINSCFTPEKGIDVIIEAVALIREKYNVKLYIAGDDDDDYKKNLKRLETLIRDLKIESSVVFLGYLSRPNVGQLLRMSDVFIDARTNGHFSSVLLEAQFFNVLTIAASNDSTRKIFNMGNGILFKESDVSSLYECILLAIEKSYIRNNVILNTKEWVKKYGLNYTDDVCFEKVENLLNSVFVRNNNDGNCFDSIDYKDLTIHDEEEEK